MKGVSGKKLCHALERRGWVCARIHGSHRIYVHPGSKVRLSVPVHGGRDLKTGLLRHLLKQAALTEDDV